MVVGSVFLSQNFEIFNLLWECWVSGWVIAWVRVEVLGSS